MKDILNYIVITVLIFLLFVLLISTGYSKEVSIMDTVKRSFVDHKAELQKNPELNNVLNELKELKQHIPTAQSSMKEKCDWFWDISSTLFNLGSDTIDPILESIYSIIKDDFLDLWNKLSLRQKAQVVVFAPTVILGLTAGSIGIAGMGTAFGVPAIFTVILCLFIAGGMVEVVVFVNWLIYIFI